MSESRKRRTGGFKKAAEVVGVVSGVVAVAVAVAANRPASAIALASAALVGFALVLRLLHERHNRLWVPLAATFVGVALVGTLHSGIRDFLVHSAIGFPRQESEVAFMLLVSDGPDAYRITAEYTNGTDTPQSVAAVEMRSSFRTDFACSGAPVEEYRLEKRLVADDVVVSPLDALAVEGAVTSSSGTVPARGMLTQSCGEGDLAVAFPALISLPARYTKRFALLVPHDLRLSGYFTTLQAVARIRNRDGSQRIIRSERPWVTFRYRRGDIRTSTRIVRRPVKRPTVGTPVHLPALGELPTSESHLRTYGDVTVTLTLAPSNEKITACFRYYPRSRPFSWSHVPRADLTFDGTDGFDRDC